MELSSNHTKHLIVHVIKYSFLNCPRTTSAGHLFDAVASLLGLCQINQYEGQAAIALENCAAASIASDQHYQFQLDFCAPIVIDW